MSQIRLANSAPLPPAPLPTFSATDLLFHPSNAHTTASVHLPPQALADFHPQRPHSLDITFACTELSSEQLDLLQGMPRDGIIAVVVGLDSTTGYVDEDQPPQIVLTVNGDGAAVYPLDYVWPWLGAEWYPEAAVFDDEQHAETHVGSREDVSDVRGSELR